MTLLNGAEAWHWALGGAVISLVTVILLAVTNIRLGISGSFENVCALVVRAPYLQRAEVARSHYWRLPFLGGLVLGGFLAAITTVGWSPTWNLGLHDRVFGFGAVGKTIWMFAGGVLIGAGTRIANGCTSGHGIFGLSNREASGLITTISFMVAGIVTTNVIFRVFGGG
jgi:uncharacterized protein